MNEEILDGEARVVPNFINKFAWLITWQEACV
jgi:hypothetical protein